MKLGVFSLSLSVKDLGKFKEFYETLGFSIMDGSMESNFLIMKNDKTLIGLFQAMFDGNILTFNPGWDENGRKTDGFDDVRAIQKHLKDKNVTIERAADETTSGPEHIFLKDPDGNMILIGQHR